MYLYKQQFNMSHLLTRVSFNKTVCTFLSVDASTGMFVIIIFKVLIASSGALAVWRNNIMRLCLRTSKIILLLFSIANIIINIIVSKTN